MPAAAAEARRLDEEEDEEEDAEDDFLIPPEVYSSCQSSADTKRMRLSVVCIYIRHAA